MIRPAPAEAEAIVALVRDALGCHCPDEVFAHIYIAPPSDILRDLSIQSLLEIGGRLMVAICATDAQAVELDKLHPFFTAGKTLRDRRGFNRFRLVVQSDIPDRYRPILLNQLAECPGMDDRMHVHVVASAVLPDCLTSLCP